MTDFVPAERSTVIRQPSTANLMLSSTDRKDWTYSALTNPFQFQITRSNSILNGFFTRVGVTELVLEWFYPNIYSQGESPLGGILSTNTFSVDISGGPFNGQNPDAQLPTGFYTVECVLDAIVADLNTQTAPGTFKVVHTNCQTSIDISGAEFSISGGSPLPWMLGMIPYGGQNAPYAASHLVTAADLRPLQYIDFVSSQLTYNQSLKDSSTNPIVKDVLARWYFAYDQPPDVDGYGFPILMGYTPFCLRRTFSPPKQIRWDSAQPIGNIAFEAYGEQPYINSSLYAPLSITNNITNWLMTLQVSEV